MDRWSIIVCIHCSVELLFVSRFQAGWYWSERWSEFQAGGGCWTVEGCLCQATLQQHSRAASARQWPFPPTKDGRQQWEWLLDDMD